MSQASLSCGAGAWTLVARTEEEPWSCVAVLRLQVSGVRFRLGAGLGSSRFVELACKAFLSGS